MSTKIALMLVLGVGLLVRVGLWASMGAPAAPPDTESYFALAGAIATLDFSEHDGFRTPGYPLFLLLLGRNETAVFVVQMTLGVATSLLLFLAFRRLTGSYRLALAAGLLFHFNLSQLQYEGVLITETLATFLVALGVLFSLQASGGASRRLWPASLAFALAALTRPIAAVVPAVLLLFWLAVSIRERRSRPWLVRGLAAQLLPLAVLLGGWSYVNYRTTGYFALSTLTGVNLTHWSGDYVESAPAEYREIAEIYRRHRQARGTSRHTIWWAMKDLQNATGSSRAELSSMLLAMSLEIIRRHPVEYLSGVARGWLDFWKPPVVDASWVPFEGAVGWSYSVVVGLEGAFLTGPVLFFSRRFRECVPSPIEWAYLYAVVLTVSLAQALVIGGENRRYSAIVDPWSVSTGLWVLVLAGRLWLTRAR